MITTFSEFLRSFASILSDKFWTSDTFLVLVCGRGLGVLTKFQCFAGLWIKHLSISSLWIIEDLQIESK